MCPQLAWNRPWLYLLRSRLDRLDDERKAGLEALLAAQPFLRPICQMKEDLFKRQDKRQCRSLVKQLHYLIDQLNRAGFEEAQIMGKTFASRIDEIGRMRRFTRNNGITEGFHRKMKLIQRRAYGFRNFKNYRLRGIVQCV
jgi:transposase